jgi:hypothetical protein
MGLQQSALDTENVEQTDLWWSLYIVDVSLAIDQPLAPTNGQK